LQSVTLEFVIILVGGLYIITSDQVRGHEDLGQLVVVLVLAIPDRVVLLVEVFPEVWDGLSGGVLVRVDSLELVHVEGSFMGMRKKNFLGFENHDNYAKLCKIMLIYL
jgi:hypothetical protein